jgi:DNA-binding NtrC family response regulator
MTSPDESVLRGVRPEVPWEGQAPMDADGSSTGTESRWEANPSEKESQWPAEGGERAAEPEAHSALVVDDEPLVRAALARALHRPDIAVFEAGDAEEALACLRARRIDLVIADQGLPATSGIELLERVRHSQPGIRRVLITGAQDFALLREAINRAGVDYFLPKPWDAEALQEVIQGLVRPQAASTPRAPEPTDRGAVDDARSPFAAIIGESRAIREPLEMVAKVAETDSTVLITGETGTGKELVGQAIHLASRRRRRVFCAVNSSAFPESLLESELFGHRRGAFTGASSNKKGLFEQAHRGTVFLDEIGEMSLSMQAKILRFLQTGEIRPVGGEALRCVDVRLVTATNKDLEAEVAARRFREDLYYRLAVIPIHIPPLRERVSDIPLLAHHFLRRISRQAGKKIEAIDREAMDLLLSHSWPGNVRELENAIERGVALCLGDRITAADLPLRVRKGPDPVCEEGTQSLQGLEKRHILETLEKVGWSRKRAAELLQISTTTLWRRLKEFGIQGNGSRTGASNGLVRPHG